MLFPSYTTLLTQDLFIQLSFGSVALKDDDPEPCNDSQAYAAVNKRVDDLLFYGEWSENNCPCPRQCNQDFYITYAETNQMGKDQENKGKLRIFYQANPEIS